MNAMSDSNAKDPGAFRTISEVADEIEVSQNVLRFWEGKFSQIKPLKRGGGRRYYRPQDVELLRGIRFLLYSEGYRISGVQRILKERGVRAVVAAPEKGLAAAPTPPENQAVSVEEAVKPQAKGLLGRLKGAESGGVQGQDKDRLRTALRELLECKRLLDQAR